MPLRFPRYVAALVAIGTAVVTAGLVAAPANAAQVRQQEWWLSGLSIANCWTASQGSGVTVAVLSDGVDASHPDLTGVITAVPPQAISSLPAATGQFFGEEGTPIASLIAGHGDGAGDAAGIIGVAPQARILSIPVTLPPDDPLLSESSVAAAIPNAIAAGIKYAVSKGATVIDLPIDPGQPGSAGISSTEPGSAAAAGGSAAEQSAVSYALAHNVVLVAPAGDDATTTDAPNYPAAYPGVIAVGAFNSAFVKAPWTSRQSYVTLTAAGAGVVAASNNGGYETVNSTSAASAIVAGVVALIRSRYPNLSVAEIRTALTTTTMFHHADGLTDGSGYGVVNAAAALSAAAGMATPASERAGADAEPPANPRPAAAGAGVPQLNPQIVRAGEVSGGVLVLLLLLVAAYAGASRRRRPGALPALAAQWTAGQAQSRYPQAVVTPAEPDRALQRLSPPAGVLPESGGQLASATGPVSASPPPGFSDADAMFAPLTATGDSGRVSYGPATRPVARRAPVSGGPPWEPAAPPDSALPWSDTPGKQLVAGQVVGSAPATDEPEPADTGPHALRPPDWRHAIPPSSEPGTSFEPPLDDPPFRLRLPLFSRAPAPADTQPASGRSDLAASVPWSGSAGAGSGSDREPGDRPAGQPRPAETDPPHPTQPAPSVHRSGLPVRQPRSVAQAPRSPSGSLWQPVAGTGPVWDSAAQLPDGDSSGLPSDDDRPIFVWEPPGSDTGGDATRPAD